LGAGAEPGSVVSVCRPEGPVNGWLAVEDEAAARSGERRCAVVGMDGESVLVVAPVLEVMVPP
jgi:hypothetical protein